MRKKVSITIHEDVLRTLKNEAQKQNLSLSRFVENLGIEYLQKTRGIPPYDLKEKEV